MAINLLNFLLVCTVYPEDAVAAVRKGVDKNGVEYTSHSQRGWFKKPAKRHPEEFVFRLEDKEAAYPPGHYFVDPNSFAQGKYDVLELSRYGFKMTPIPQELYGQLGLREVEPLPAAQSEAAPVKAGKQPA